MITSTDQTKINSVQNKVASRRLSKRSNRERGLGYENLEARLVLAAFVVNSAVDDASGAVDGLISLREAVIAANTNAAFGDAPAGDANGDTLQFAASLNNSTLTLTAGEIEISDDLLVQGGGSNITIDANNASRHFSVTTSERVAFGRLGFINGMADQGGSISATGGGNTLISASSFTSNEATGMGGGAIYNETGDLYVTSGSTFTNNSASGESGSGGAILNASGSTAVNGGSMLSNTANRAGGAIEVVNGQFYSTNLTVGAEGMGNVAGPNGSAAPGNGGGLHVTSNATVAIRGGSYIDNFAASEGGGLWNQAGTNMFINGDAVISGNEAAGADATNGGGGIFNNGGNLYVNGSTVSGNMATGAAGSGGGVFSTAGNVVLLDSDIIGNSAVRAGGGVEIIDGQIAINKSNLSGNDAGVTLTAAPGNGGGLHVSGAATTLVSSSLVADNQAAREGGGLWNQAGATMFITGDTQISGNAGLGAAADDGGGGIFNNGGDVYIKQTSISNNTAAGAAGSGGGIFSTAGLVRVMNSSVQSNSAVRAGGGIEIIDGTLRFENSLLSNNDVGVRFTAAPGNGGGLHVTGNTALALFAGSTVANNVAANQGGGLWNQTGSNLLLRDGTSVTGNRVTGSGSVGGGVYNKGYIQAVDSYFGSNSSPTSGGGIFNTSTGTGLIQNSGFRGNSAATNGAAISNSGLLRVVDSTFADNTASSDGDIFTNTDGKTILENNTFTSNPL